MTYSNNKKLGTSFEQYVCKLLARDGYWVHFIAPDARGAQPFDIVAVKNGKAHAIECKTLRKEDRDFRLERLEQNQVLAFQRWVDCGNGMPKILVYHDHEVYVVPYDELLKAGKINLYKEGKKYVETGI